MTTPRRAIRGRNLILLASVFCLGVLGGRRNLVGSYPETGMFFLAANFT